MPKGAIFLISIGLAILAALGSAALLWRGTGPDAAAPGTTTTERRIDAGSKQGPAAPSLALKTEEAKTLLPHSFQSATDLFSFATAALVSNDPGVVFEGYQAARQCEGLLSLSDDLRMVADGGASPKRLVRGEITEPQRLAILDLLKRCDGFTKIDYRERAKFAERFVDRGKELNAVEFRTATSSLDGDASSETFIQLLSSNSPTAKQTALVALPVSGSDPAGLNAEELQKRKVRFVLAALLASCDLGLDCSGNSFNQRFSCATTGRCSDGPFDKWEADFTEPQVREIRGNQSRLVQAVKSGDFSSLGL